MVFDMEMVRIFKRFKGTFLFCMAGMAITIVSGACPTHGRYNTSHRYSLSQ